MLEIYFKNLYERTMNEAYACAHHRILGLMSSDGKCLDCGANTGYKYEFLKEALGISPEQYMGIEWNEDSARKAQRKNINVIHGDLNQKISLPSKEFKCIFALSVLEHLLNPCHFIKECFRLLEKDGELILLTPNISTYFTAALILIGKMPSSGPHPDSELLLENEELFKISNDSIIRDTESDNPCHRHLVVFSYRVLRSYLALAGFSNIKGYGFCLYPFPNFLQPILEKIDPYHCHQMVFIAKK